MTAPIVEELSPPPKVGEALAHSPINQASCCSTVH